MSLIKEACWFAAEAHRGQKYGENDYFSYHICSVVSDLERRYCGWGWSPVKISSPKFWIYVPKPPVKEDVDG